MLRFISFLIASLLLYGCVQAPQMTIKNWVYQLQEASPVEIASSGFDIAVMDYSWDGSEEEKYTPEEIEIMKEAGVIPIAYISIGEAEDYRFYWKEEWEENPPEWLGRENEEWEGNYAVRYWMDEWKEIVFQYLDEIIDQGFMGVYLDKVDEFEYWADPENGEGEYYEEELTAEWMAEFITEIASYVGERAGKDFLIIPQNGERLLEYEPSLLDVVSGWAAEDLFYDGTIPKEDEERIDILDEVVKKGKIVLSVDYVDDGSGYTRLNKSRIDDYIEKARAHGFIPYAARSDRELDEINAIPGIQPRR